MLGEIAPRGARVPFLDRPNVAERAGAREAPVRDKFGEPRSVRPATFSVPAPPDPFDPRTTHRARRPCRHAEEDTLGTGGNRSAIAGVIPSVRGVATGRVTLGIVGHAAGPSLFILTGAPGSGKTAILSPLSNAFRCVDEPAREVLAEQRATGGSGTWDQDPSLFVHLLLQRSIEKYEAGRRSGETVIFDRGIPDCVVYAIRAGTDPTPSLTAASEFRYQPHVLFLEPWSDIYETDEERTMSFDDTQSFSEALRDVYERSGYVLVHVPRGSIEDRAAFVREFLALRT
jgi:predicted ATPase